VYLLAFVRRLMMQEIEDNKGVYEIMSIALMLTSFVGYLVVITKNAN
jgi:hypothetical protein